MLLQTLCELHHIQSLVEMQLMFYKFMILNLSYIECLVNVKLCHCVMSCTERCTEMVSNVSVLALDLEGYFEMVHISLSIMHNFVV